MRRTSFFKNKDRALEEKTRLLAQVNTSKQLDDEQRKRAYSEETNDWKSSLDKSLTNARLEFAAFFIYLAYYFSATFSTTHLDLLLDTKISVLFQVLELPRILLIGIGALILVALHYKVLWDHQRAYWQLAKLKSIAEPDKHEELSKKLSGNLLIDVVLPARNGRGWRLFAIAFLSLVLVLGPVICLLFSLTTTLPRHSEWLTWSIRSALVADLTIIVLFINGSIVQNSISLAPNANRTQTKKRLMLSTLYAAAICVAGLSTTVLTFPGEILEKKWVSIATLASKSFVVDPDNTQDGTILWALGFHCRFEHDVPRTTGRISFHMNDDVSDPHRALEKSSVVPERQAINLRVWNTRGHVYHDRSTQSVVFKEETKLDEIDYPFDSICKSEGKGLVLQYVLSKQVVRAIGRFGKRSLDLSDQVISGRNLSSDEREVLRTHTSDAALHPRFYEILSKVEELNLRDRELQYATFSRAWLPKTVIDSKRAKGASFRGANLQGATILDFTEVVPRVMKEAHTDGRLIRSRLHGADLSGGHLYGALFEDIELSVTAIQAAISQSTFLGGRLEQSDFRYAELKAVEAFQAKQFQSTSTNLIVSSTNFSNANFESSRWHKTLFHKSSLVGVNLGQTFFSDGVIFQNSSLALSDLSSAQLGNVVFKFCDLSLTRFTPKQFRSISVLPAESSRQSASPTPASVEISNTFEDTLPPIVDFSAQRFWKPLEIGPEKLPHLLAFFELYSTPSRNSDRQTRGLVVADDAVESKHWKHCFVNRSSEAKCSERGFNSKPQNATILVAKICELWPNAVQDNAGLVANLLTQRSYRDKLGVRASLDLAIQLSSCAKDVFGQPTKQSSRDIDNLRLMRGLF